MIGHQAIRGKPDCGALAGWLENLLERLVIGRFIEQPQPPNAAVEHVIG